MDREDWLAQRFEANRTRLRAAAYRMLGSASEADDAVQESWVRLSRADASGINDLGAWLQTVVARVCLDMLRTRKSRREHNLELEALDAPSTQPGVDPEQEAVTADSVGSALLVVLDTLGPAERIAFVLHDLFAMPFDEIAPIIGRSPVAARQLASRARRRVQGGSAKQPADLERKRAIIDAFLAASRRGDFQGLLAVLDPQVVVLADAAAVRMGGSRRVAGAAAAAKTFAGRARAAQPALIDGSAGLVWARDRRPRVAFIFGIEADKIVEIELVADRDQLEALEIRLLAEGPGAAS